MVEWLLLYGFSKFSIGSEAVKEDLKKWNKEEFGDLAFKKKSLLSKLLGLDAKEDISSLSHEEQAHRT